jgi:hypothetical protein
MDWPPAEYLRTGRAAVNELLLRAAGRVLPAALLLLLFQIVTFPLLD